MTDDSSRLAAALRSAASGRILAVTGAGISKASGLPTFRGSEPGAVWRRDDVELATFSFFLAEPVAQWRWYLERFRAVDGARPNPAHFAMAAIESWAGHQGADFLLVTQNIDLLHEAAGSRALVKVHGSANRVRCSRHGCRAGAPAGSLPRAAVDLAGFAAVPSPASLPRCPHCDGLLRAHVLFFDELYSEHDDYEFERVEQAAARADLVLFIGTSFSVGVTDLVLRSALGRGATVVSIDPGAAPSRSGARVTVLRAPAEDLLPAACRELGAGIAAGVATHR